MNSCSEPVTKLGTSENPYNIIWYTIGVSQKDLPMVQAKANEYLRKKIGVELDITIIDWGNYNQKMNMISISGQEYDLCFTSSWTNNYVNQTNRGAFYPLSKLLNKYGQGIKKVLNPYFLSGPRIDGEIYGIPCNKEVAQQNVYRFNANFLKELGFSFSNFNKNEGINSLKTIEPYLKVVKEKMGGQGIIPYSVWKHYTYLLPNQAYIFGNSGLPGAVFIEKDNYKIINQWETKEFQEYLELYHEFYNKGYIAKDAAMVDDGNSTTLSEKFAVNNAQYQPFADVAWSESAGYKIISFPSFRPIITNSSVTGAMIAMSINARRPDLNMKFLNLLNTDVYLRNLLQYGIEGLHYEKTGPNRIKYLPAHNNYIMAGFTLGNLFLTYLLPGDPDNKWEQFKKWNASAIPSQVLGFHMDILPVASIMASVVNVTKQYNADLMTGTVDPKVYLPMYMKALKTAGVDQLLVEMQRQLDKWAKTKKDQNLSKKTEKDKSIKVKIK